MPTRIETNLNWAQKAVGYVRGKIKTAENVDQDVDDYIDTHGGPQLAYAGRAAISTGSQQVESEVNAAIFASMNRLIPPDTAPVAKVAVFKAGVTDPEAKQLQRKFYATVAPNNEFGTCERMASLAYQYLKDNAPVGPIEMVRFTAENVPGRVYDHVWVMIGRNIHGADFRERDPATWGNRAVWCDPWQRTRSLLGRVYENARWLADGVEPPPSPQFFLDTAEHVREGIPSSTACCNAERSDPDDADESL